MEGGIGGVCLGPGWALARTVETLPASGGAGRLSGGKEERRPVRREELGDALERTPGRPIAFRLLGVLPLYQQRETGR